MIPVVLIIGVASVLVVEGLILALAPHRVEKALAALAALQPDRRRLLGLGALAAGVALAALARSLAG